MIKHNITYVDFNGVERNEDFYFHLTVPEVTRLEAEVGVDLATYAKEVTESGDAKKIVEFLEKIVKTSYGEKSEDGRTFVKNERLLEAFEYSQAYAELFQQLIMDREFAQVFGTGIATKGISSTNAGN